MASADVLVIPKGAPNRDTAMKFLAEAASLEGQKKFMDIITAEEVDGGVTGSGNVQTLPEGGANQVTLGLEWWGNNRDLLADRWYEWQAQ